ncbi:uncharacterized protein [Polyergus mexicanus]|uniref:uncharacterized protein isoform X3 n=1 Tax=Polyergus mexicanus TaxID=615972 RepID=UPI0038B5E14B
MISLETQHFNINRILLLIIGLWPYQRSLLVELQLILFYGILMTFIVFQLTTFITAECTLDLIYKVLSSAFFYICFAIKYNSFWINADIIRTSLKQLQDVCNEITDKNEIAIIEKYGDKAKRITILILLLGMFHQVTFTFIYIWPYIHHNMVFTNKSRLHSSEPIMTEYFIDQEKYSYLITLHRHATCCIGLLAIIATGTMLLSYLQHTCAMFSIACYRIEHAMNILQKSYQNEQKSCEEIIRAVNIHCKAMKYNVRWYMAPIHIQKIILFLLQRGTKSFHLILGGVFVGSLQSAASRALPYRTSPFFILPSKNKNMVKQFLIFLSRLGK